MRRNGESADGAPNEAADVDCSRDVAAQSRVPQNPASAVEGNVVGGQTRRFALAGREAGIVAECFRVCRQKVMREREAAREKLVADLLGRDTESKNDSVAPGVAIAPV